LTPFDDDEASTIDDQPAPWRRDVRSSDGVALLIAVLILAVVSLLGATPVTLGNVDLALSSNYPVQHGFLLPRGVRASIGHRRLVSAPLTASSPRSG